MIVLSKGDYNTVLVLNLKSKENPIPLVGARVVFEFVSKASGNKVGGGECKILDVVLGIVEYEFKEPELNACGDYQGKIIVDLAQGAKRESITYEIKIIGE
jgi:hypothetical protein